MLAQRARQWLSAGVMALCLSAPASAQPIDIDPLITATGADVAATTLVVRRMSDGQSWVANPTRAARRFSPASTSKIPHTLIALDQGLATPDTVFPWDGVARASLRWNRDQTLASAFRFSAVWVYQTLARRAGAEVVADGLAQFDYGNADIGSADQLTTYWLDDTLKISAEEQVTFLSKLASGALPLSAQTYAAARDIMVSDEGGAWVMRSKTGWRHSPDAMDVGWFVGWLDCAGEVYVFALNLDMPDTRSLSQRQSITYAVLRDIGAFRCA